MHLLAGSLSFLRMYLTCSCFVVGELVKLAAGCKQTIRLWLISLECGLCGMQLSSFFYAVLSACWLVFQMFYRLSLTVSDLCVASCSSCSCHVFCVLLLLVLVTRLAEE